MTDRIFTGRLFNDIAALPFDARQDLLLAMERDAKNEIAKRSIAQLDEIVVFIFVDPPRWPSRNDFLGGANPTQVELSVADVIAVRKRFDEDQKAPPPERARLATFEEVEAADLDGTLSTSGERAFTLVLTHSEVVELAHAMRISIKTQADNHRVGSVSLAAAAVLRQALELNTDVVRTINRTLSRTAARVDAGLVAKVDRTPGSEKIVLESKESLRREQARGRQATEHPAITKVCNARGADDLPCVRGIVPHAARLGALLQADTYELFYRLEFAKGNALYVVNLTALLCGRIG